MSAEPSPGLIQFIRQVKDGESPLVSWKTWDQIKHAEWFVFAAVTMFVGLFSFVFRNVPLIPSGYSSLVTTMFVWMIFALSFNLLLGQTGLLSFGHAMFWAGGAYAGALFATYVYPAPILILAMGVLFSIVVAAGTALILLRLHTVYFAIVTLAFGQLLYYLVRVPLEPITGGINGIRVRPEPAFGVMDLSHSLPGILGTLWGGNMYVFLGAFLIGVVVFLTRVRKSPHGLLYKAVRENETRASFVGLNVWRYKFTAYVLSGAIAGLAGTLYLLESTRVTAGRGEWTVSGDVVVMSVLGGLGTIVGPILGAFTFHYFQGVLDNAPVIGGYQTLAIAVFFTIVVWVYPTGMWGGITSITAELRDPKQFARKLKRLPARVANGITARIGGDR